MKKIITSILAVTLAVAMLFTFTACKTDNRYKTIEEYINSDIVQAELETLRGQFEPSGLEIEILGEDNKLVYQYTISADVVYDGMAEVLEAGLDTQAETFTGVATGLKAAVAVENPAVVVRYMASDGNLIFEKEYPAE